MDKRHQRMLEEVIKMPGNQACADCHSPAPRWASVNLGIFLCVSCASIHRKMGTHRSRVKSVTLDEWTRDQINHMKSMGNINSNAIWNPNESLHPPPTATGADERDSEMEKYIRRKYEQGAFKPRSNSSSSTRPAPAPTSLNRARERDGKSLSPWLSTSMENRRTPELNDIVVKKSSPTNIQERELPAIPVSPNKVPTPTAPPRSRPIANGTGNTAGGGATPTATSQNQLIDLSGGISSTLPLQINSAFPNQPQMGVQSTSYGGGQSAHLNVPGMQQQQQQQAYSAPSTSTQQSFNPFLQPQQPQPQQQQQMYSQISFQPQSFQNQYINQSTPQYQSYQQQSSPNLSMMNGNVNGYHTQANQMMVGSPYGQSAMHMGMQNANNGGGAGYFGTSPNGMGQQQPQQWQGQGQQMQMGTGMPMQMQGGQMHNGMGMGMGMGMNMNMGMAGQYGSGMMH